MGTKNKLISSLLSVTLLLGGLLTPQANAGTLTKKRTVIFNEKLDGSSQSQTINIPDVSEIVSARVVNSEGGTANARITGKDTVKVDVSGGRPSRSVINPQKYSDYVTAYSTSGVNNFSGTKYYTSGGKSGYLSKSGSAWVTSGSYTEQQSKLEYVTKESVNSEPEESIYYSQNGFSGILRFIELLSKTESRTEAYVSDSDPFALGCTPSRQTGDMETDSTFRYAQLGFDYDHWGNPINRYLSLSCHYNYDYPSWAGADGYYYQTSANTSGVEGPFSQVIPGVFKGYKTTTKYTARYGGTVRKPATDTRVWRQDYSGYIYQGGYDNYYRYEVELEYIDDITPPTLSHTVTPSEWTTQSVTINIKSVDTQSGVKNIELPNGQIVHKDTSSYTVSTNGRYTFYSTDNAGNKTTAYHVDIKNIDKTAPTNGNLKLTSPNTDEVEFEVTNVIEEQSGLSETPLDIFVTSESGGGGSKTSKAKLKDTLSNFEPNEQVGFSYRVSDKLENQSNKTTQQTVHTLAQQPKDAELRDYTGNSISFKYNHPVQFKDAKYRFKAISDTGEEVLSSIYDYDSLVNITGLKKNTKYVLYATGINNDNVYNKYTKLKDTISGGDLTVVTKNKTKITTEESEGWNNHTFTAYVEDLDLDNTRAELLVGDKVILLDEVLYKTDITSKRTLEINLNKDKQGVSRSIEGIKDKFNVGLDLSDGRYPVALKTTKEGDEQTLKLGHFGVDTTGPSLKETPTLNILTGNRGILLINTSKLSDLSTSLSEMEMNLGNGWRDVRSQVMIDTKPSVIKFRDKFNNESEYQISVTDNTPDPNPPTGGDDDDFNTGVIEDEIPSNIKDNVVTITVPKGGSHMQTSLDGVTWSSWEARTDTTRATLPTGDGLKSVYVRTGVQKYKETPVFNSATGMVEFIAQEGGSIEPLDNMRINKYIMDLTAPKLSIRTMDNSLIAINGNITFLVDVVDNIDEQPKIKVDVLERDGNGTLKATPIFSKTAQIAQGRTTGTITPSKLKESRNSQNKLQPYTLRVTAYDSSGNRSVEHLNFYVKNK